MFGWLGFGSSPSHIKRSRPLFYLNESRIVEANGDAVPFETEFIKGIIQVLMRTSATSSSSSSSSSSPSSSSSSSTSGRFAGFFRGNSRQFGLQVRFTVKDNYDENLVLFVGAQVPEMQALGLAMRSVTSLGLKMCTLFDPNIHVSMGTNDRRDGGEEPPHITFPFSRLSRDVVVTPAGQNPGEMNCNNIAYRGQSPPVTNEEAVHVKRGYIYTLTFDTCFLDIEGWRLVNIPGVPPISLSTLLGNVSIFIVAYLVSKTEDGVLPKRHPSSRRKAIFQVELVHSSLERYREISSLYQRQQEEDDNWKNQHHGHKHKHPPPDVDADEQGAAAAAINNNNRLAEEKNKTPSDAHRAKH